MLVALAALALFQADNTLTADELKAGWKLLFDGKTTAGWHNFKAKGVRPGWVVKDNALTISDPGNAGDIVTDEKFDWFDLELDYNVEKAQNSGVMFRIADDGDETWHSGPEIQIFDHQDYVNPQKTGWLYELYSSPVDTTKPAGQWNHMRILVAPDKCATFINGTKYYEYVLGSDDFWARVKKSKFSEYPGFAKQASGSIGIQGDHGLVGFKNIKIRRLATR